MLGEDVGRAAAVRTDDDLDLAIGQLVARIGIGNRLVVPARDFAQEDAYVSFAGKLQVLDAGKVVGQHDAVRGHRQKLHAGVHLAISSLDMAASLAPNRLFIDDRFTPARLP